jgi:hypothetical protein
LKLKTMKYAGEALTNPKNPRNPKLIAK